MRIAFLVNDFPMLSETFILNQATGLIDRGHDVDIYTQNIGDWSKVHPDVNRYRLWERTYPMLAPPKNYFWRILKGIGLFLGNVYKAPQLIGRSLNVLAYGEQAINLWLLYTGISLLDKDLDYDLIHCQFGTQAYRGLAFKQLLPSHPKLLVMFRGFDISCYLDQGGKYLYSRLFKDIDYCLANCDFFRRRAIDLGCNPNQISVHFSGLDVSKFKFRSRHLAAGESVRIATIGRLVEKKGIEYAIRAVSKQVDSHSTLNYYIIGDGPLHRSLELLIKDLDAESYIHLLGWRNESEIIDILETCHIFIAPSVTAADGNQDAPINVLKEAMAMGLPVISTYHGGIPELVEDGISGFLVPERDEDTLAEKLAYLIRHPDCWPEMGRAGRCFIERYFDLHQLNNQLVNHYEQIVNSTFTKLFDCMPADSSHDLDTSTITSVSSVSSTKSGVNYD